MDEGGAAIDDESDARVHMPLNRPRPKNLRELAKIEAAQVRMIEAYLRAWRAGQLRHASYQEAFTARASREWTKAA